MPQAMETEEFLEHFGVKGMHWGVRKDRETPKISRKQNRRMNKEARDKFNSEKASALYNAAKKGGEKTLITSRLPGDTAHTIMTGKQFAEHLELGGAFDVRSTEIFATQIKAGEQFVLNDNTIGNYKKTNYRKTA